MEQKAARNGVRTTAAGLTTTDPRRSVMATADPIPTVPGASLACRELQTVIAADVNMARLSVAPDDTGLESRFEFDAPAVDVWVVSAPNLTAGEG